MFTHIWAEDLYSSAYQALQKREETLKHYTLKWRFVEKIFQERLDPEAMIRSVEMQGGYVDEKTKKDLRDFYSKDRECQHEDKIHIQRAGDQLLFKGVEGVCTPEGGVHKERFYLYFNTIYTAYFPQDIRNEPIIVSLHTNPAVLCTTSHKPLLPFPIDMVFITNYNVLNIMQSHDRGIWNVINNTKTHLVLEATLPHNASYSGYEDAVRWIVGLNKLRGFAPEWAKEYYLDGEGNDPVIEIEVKN